MSEESQAVVLEVRVPRFEQKPKEGDLTPESMETFLSSLAVPQTKTFLGGLSKLFNGAGSEFYPVSLELVAFNQTVHFLITTHIKMLPYITSQITASYPKAVVTEVNDYLPQWYSEIISDKSLFTACGYLSLTAPSYYPLKSWHEFEQSDPLAQTLSVLSKLGPSDKLLSQMVIAPTGSSWANAGWSVVQRGIPQPDGLTTKAHPHEKIIKEKISGTGFQVTIKLLCTTDNEVKSQGLLNQLANSYATFTSQDGNSLALKKPWAWQKENLIKSMVERDLGKTKQVFTIPEIASLFHLPGFQLAQLPNLSWVSLVSIEPPENLPIAKDMSEDEKKTINFIGRTQFKNALSTFGIRREDRRRHVYVIGKSGTGKTTLIANMAIADMRNGEGVGVIDPHGDLCDKILDFIPSHRLNDVVFLDPSDSEHPFHLNILELSSNDQNQKNLVVSGIVSIFNKLYSYSWGPRLEYILRNSIQTLVDTPGATLVQIPDLLTNDRYRAKVVEKLADQVLKNFWLNEFNRAEPRIRSEWISPILNKVGQFIGSPIIRSIIGNPRSTVDMERIMNEGKILILNLSQGKIGEDNAALLGAMFITKLQLYAMNRAHIAEDQRRDFFLYVDEFQNFATESFGKILSEARKYRLDLTVANQYIGQVPEELQKAVFGNIGTIISFVVGSQDAHWLYSEFNGLYQESDLVALGNYQIAIKMTIAGLTSKPFTANTLPLPKSKNQNRDKIIRLSREKFTKPPKPDSPLPQPSAPPITTPPATNSHPPAKPSPVQPPTNPKTDPVS